MIKIAIAIAGALLLSACSLSPQVDADIIDYNGAVADSADKMLLLNILRARDHAPLHFSSVALVHGSLQAQGSASVSLPFGNPPIKGNNNFGLSMGTQVSPTFDVSSLDTQDFTRGILQPIDPLVVKYFLDRGEIDPKIILLLFFSEIEDASGNIIKVDAEGAKSLRTALADLSSGKLVATRLVANAYDELTPVGAPLTKKQVGALKDLDTIDQTKYRLRRDPKDKKKYVLYAVSAAKKVAFCVRAHQGKQTRFIPLGDVFRVEDALGANSDKCTQSEIVAETGAARGSNQGEFESVTMRSVEGMIQFLGGLLRYEHSHGDAPLTFDYFIRVQGAGEPAPLLFGGNTDDIVFDVHADAQSTGLSLNYHGERYGVGGLERPDGRKDHTLEVLALVSQMLNMNKAAKDLPVTQSVQIVP